MKKPAMTKDRKPKCSLKTKTADSSAYKLLEVKSNKWIGTLQDGTIAIICSNPKIARQYTEQLAKVALGRVLMRMKLEPPHQ